MQINFGSTEMAESAHRIQDENIHLFLPDFTDAVMCVRDKSYILLGGPRRGHCVVHITRHNESGTTAARMDRPMHPQCMPPCPSQAREITIGELSELLSTRQYELILTYLHELRLITVGCTVA